MRELIEIVASNVLIAAMLAAIAVGVTRSRRSPAFAHCLWLLVLIKLVTPPIVRVPIPVAAFVDAAPPAVAEVVPASDLAAASPPSTSLASIDWLVVLGAVWAVGCAWVLALAAVRAHRFAASLRCARPVSGSIAREAASIARRFGIARPPLVRQVPGRMSPMLWAVGGRAHLLLPARLLERLTREQRVALVAHELAHLCRRDHVVRFLELAVRAVHWWNPIAWWACRRLHAVEEECCDAWVLWAVPGGSRAYADALLETVEFLSDEKGALPAMASGAGRADNLRWRLVKIMQGNQNRTMSRGGRAAVAVVAALALPLLPAYAQDIHTHTHTHVHVERSRDAAEILRAAVRELETGGREKEAQAVADLLARIEAGEKKTDTGRENKTTYFFDTAVKAAGEQAKVKDKAKVLFDDYVQRAKKAMSAGEAAKAKALFDRLVEREKSEDSGKVTYKTLSDLFTERAKSEDSGKVTYKTLSDLFTERAKSEDSAKANYRNLNDLFTERATKRATGTESKPRVDFFRYVDKTRDENATKDTGAAKALVDVYRRAKAGYAERKPAENPLDLIYAKKAQAADARVRELEKRVQELAEIVEKLRDDDAKHNEKRLN